MNKGFTLIELLVVVLILGILAAIALPQYQKAVQKTRVMEGVQLMSALERAAQNYIAERNPSEEQETMDISEELVLDFPDFEDEAGGNYCNNKGLCFSIVTEGPGVKISISSDFNSDGEGEYGLYAEVGYPGGGTYRDYSSGQFDLSTFGLEQFGYVQG